MNTDIGANSDARQESLVRVAILLSLAVMWSILAVSALRSGLGDGAFFLVSIAAFGLAGIWLPLIGPLPGCGDGAASAGGTALGMILGPVLPVLGVPFGTAASWIAAGIFVVAIVRRRKIIAQVLQGSEGRLGLAIGSLLLALFILVASEPWRLFIPEAISLGVAQADSYFHVSISQIFAVFKLPSTGGDGLAIQHYHFGSHIVAAGLAEAASARASQVYAYWGLVNLKVQLLWAFVFGNILLGNSSRSTLRLLPLLAYVAAFLLLGPLESESFMLALAVFAGAAPLMCSLFTRDDHGSVAYRAGALTVLLAAFICATAKVSVGYFCAAALGWMLWRGRDRRLNVVFLALGLCALGAYTVVFVLPFEQSLLSAGLGILIGSYGQYATLANLLSFALPCLVVWAYVHGLSISATGSQSRHTTVSFQVESGVGWRNVRDRLVSGSGVMQLHALCLIAFGLVLVTMPIGSGMAYFSYVLLFLPALVSPTWLFSGYQSAKGVRQATGVICAVTIFCLAVAFAVALAHSVSALAKSAQQQTAATFRDANDSAGLGRRAIEKSLRQSGSLFGQIRIQVDHTAWADLINRIRSEAAGPTLQVFVPPANEEFWTRLGAGAKNPYWCMQAHLMIPAELGVAMLRGIAPLRYEGGCSAIAGIYGFGEYQDRHRTAEYSDLQLCEFARGQNFASVYVLNSVSRLADNRVLRCAAP